MTTEHWSRIEALYHEMLSYPLHERARALAAACAGDVELYAEVQSLLDQESADGFLDKPALEAAAYLVSSASLRLTGRRIGVFEVKGLLGAGGMGEVYRAQDTRLGREVAIKILPQAFRDDPARVARFEREARMLAALNHPHIGAIYGLEDADEVQALVMELVEGHDLSKSIAPGGIPIRDAFTIARQIAEALEAAHEQGIIHRDLKPANIKLRRDGTVKVLDFGLAKPVSPAADDSPVSTIAPQSGVIMGTSAYMSPEQARGEPVDRQSDIWSFGVVLYELLTGVSPFRRHTTSETQSSVFEEQPDYSLLPLDTPECALRLVRRCLEKDRKRRLQHIGDARIEVEEALTALMAEATPRSAHTLSTFGRVPQAAAVMVLVLLAGFTGWFLGSRDATPSPAGVVRLSIPSLQPPFLAPFGEHHLAISADGSRLAYASASRLWIRRMGQTEAVTVETGASDPFFSPDGEWVGFFVRAGDLKKVSVFGGAPVTIATIAGRPSGGAWRADGTIVFATSEGLYQVSENGGETQVLLKPDPVGKERAYAWPQFMPDGRSVLFTIVPEGSIDGAQIAVVDLNTLKPRVVLTGGSAARYTSAGYLVYASTPISRGGVSAARGGTLNVIAFDPNSQETRGEPVSLPDVEISMALDNGAAQFTISETGTLLFIKPYVSGPLRTLSWVDRHGNEEPLGVMPNTYLFPRVSPDGSRVALDIPGANRDVWILDLQRGGLTRLTTGSAEDILPLWVGTDRLFFASQRNGNFDVYAQAADGATPERVVFEGPGDQMPNALTPDRTRLLVNENFKDLSVLNLEAPAHIEPLLNSEFSEWVGELSPDGKWIAYESNESGDRIEIFLRPFPNVDEWRTKVSIDGGRYPAWAPNGSGELFYVDPSGGMMTVSVESVPTLRIGAVAKLFDVGRPPSVITARPYDISPLDGRFLITKPATADSQQLIDISVVLNWLEELGERVPLQTR